MYGTPECGDAVASAAVVPDSYAVTSDDSMVASGD